MEFSNIPELPISVPDVPTSVPDVPTSIPELPISVPDVPTSVPAITLKTEELNMENPSVIMPIPLITKQKSLAILAVTQITFKQIFENLINQDIKEVDGHNINIKQGVKEYFVYMCKERVEFFTAIEFILKTIIIDNNVHIKHIPMLLNFVITTYNDMKLDKEYIKNADPKEIIKLLFEVAIMLFISTNDIENELLHSELLNIIESSILLISTKPIKTNHLQKVKWAMGV